MTTKKSTMPKVPKPKQPTPEATRAAVVADVVAILAERRRVLLEAADRTLFHGRTSARVEECHEIEREVLKMLHPAEDSALEPGQ